ncbi:RNA-binding RNA processing protein [Martiniozyma asiatica (nom. inval.)]|nr:RNA-binding RNA processing protein [Martiniozyma asiatica]
MGKVRGRRVKKETTENEENENFGNEEIVTQQEEPKNQSTAFFGLVDSSELTYFHQAEQTLNLNTFQSNEEKLMFIQSVFQEAKGKELKLVTNQICSKLMERLILQSSLKQIHQLFNAFNGKFFDLSKQKYSSHVLETFLVRCAAFIEKEILSNGSAPNDYEEEEEEIEEGWISMENMFLYIINEFKPNLKSMMKDKYASHVLRLTLLVMTGKELPSAVQSNSILRSKKSKIARKMIEIKDNEDYQKQFQVPSSFKNELSQVLKTISNDENTVSLRELAIDSIASPVIQLLIQLEGIADKDRTFWSTIFNGGGNDSKINEKESAFVEYLLSDAIGSHFLQSSIENQKTKNIERIYHSYMKDRIVKLAKRETTGVYVVDAMMDKLKVREQQEILDNLVPILNELIINNLEIGGKIVECSQNNGDYLKNEIVNKFLEFFTKGTEGKSDLLENVLRYSTSTLFSTNDDWPTSEERRRALFLEKLIAYDEKILRNCVDTLGELDDKTLVLFCKHGVFSHIIESCMEQTDYLTQIDRKSLLLSLTPHTVELACHSTGSHIVDKLWKLSFKLNMFKERIAKALFDNSETIKSTVYGKMVWKNWKMDLYSRRFQDWKRIVKDEEFAAAADKGKELTARDANSNTDLRGKKHGREQGKYEKNFTSNKKPRGRGRR